MVPHTSPNSTPGNKLTHVQTALFNFQSLLLVLLLTICTATYAHYVFPGIIDRNKENYFVSPIWKAARVGERLSPYVSLACVIMAVSSGSAISKIGTQGARIADWATAQTERTHRTTGSLGNDADTS